MSFTSHLCELNETESESSSGISGSPESNHRRFRRCKSYCGSNSDKRHVRRRTSPNSYFDFSLSPEIQRHLNIGMDLVLLDQLNEKASSNKNSILPPSKHRPPSNIHSFDATLGLLSLKINDDTDRGREDSTDSLSSFDST